MKEIFDSNIPWIFSPCEHIFTSLLKNKKIQKIPLTCVYKHVSAAIMES